MKTVLDSMRTFDALDSDEQVCRLFKDEDGYSVEVVCMHTGRTELLSSACDTLANMSPDSDDEACCIFRDEMAENSIQVRNEIRVTEEMRRRKSALLFEAAKGITVQEAAYETKVLAVMLDRPVTMLFCGERITVDQRSFVDDIVRIYALTVTTRFAQKQN